ncbi:hypothetical protein STVIR_8053 [Streptomyces viridochromogenes Tue57]|uniref:Uncharacterized protein n=1 Tax=Streptomyces viridochromogenes Tue57 TaxID=1160705 RepID=L8P4C8_STRVR|nr:hypothetical protein STVIR_8053 [Streptomyces viridochromogenes Tue57]
MGITGPPADSGILGDQVPGRALAVRSAAATRSYG